MAFHFIQIFCTPATEANPTGCAVFRHNDMDVEASRQGFSLAPGDTVFFLALDTKARVRFEDDRIFGVDRVDLDNFAEIGLNALVKLSTDNNIAQGASAEFFVDCDACDDCRPPDPPEVRVEN